MTHNDALQRTPHPARGGGSNASPGVKGERGGGGEEENHRGAPLLGKEGDIDVPLPVRGGGVALRTETRVAHPEPEGGRGAPPYPQKKGRPYLATERGI